MSKHTYPLNILKLRRTLELNKNILSFNKLHPDFIDNSWLGEISVKSILNHYVEYQDNWLRIISLPLKQFNCLFDFAILILFFHDKRLSINGKVLLDLQKHFTNYEIKLAIKLANLLEQIQDPIQKNATILQYLKYIYFLIFFCCFVF